MIRPPILGALILTAVLAASVAQAQGDPRRGGQVYRACMSCHSLEPGVHLTGPSLAGLWDRPAGRVDDFARYSAGLRYAAFDLDAAVPAAWLADPRAMSPTTPQLFSRPP